jgi:hypothetical protein
MSRMRDIDHTNSNPRNLSRENLMGNPFLSRKSKRTEEVSQSGHYQTYNEEPNVSNEDPELEAKDQTFSFAEASKLAELLLEQSRRSKSGFFNPQKPRRPLKSRRALSDGCLLSKGGVDAPTSTPDMMFNLSRYPSLTSTTSTQPSSFALDKHTSKLSLAETCSTTEDIEIKHTVTTEETVSTVEQPVDEGTPSKAIPKDSASLKCLPRTESSSFGSNLVQAKRWGRTMLQEIKAPLRRHKIRQGKQPALHNEVVYISPPRVSGYKPAVSKDVLDVAFTRPSSSRELQYMNLPGGVGPPKYLSQQTLDRLDEFDREQERIKKELERIDKGREELLRRAENEDSEEQDGLTKKAKEDQKDTGSQEKQKKEKKKDKKGGKTTSVIKFVGRGSFRPRQII